MIKMPTGFFSGERPERDHWVISKKHSPSVAWWSIWQVVKAIYAVAKVIITIHGGYYQVPRDGKNGAPVIVDEEGYHRWGSLWYDRIWEKHNWEEFNDDPDARVINPAFETKVAYAVRLYERAHVFGDSWAHRRVFTLHRTDSVFTCYYTIWNCAKDALVPIVNFYCRSPMRGCYFVDQHGERVIRA